MTRSSYRSVRPSVSTTLFSGGGRGGDRVAIPWLGYACGVCGYCIDGRERLCESQKNTGYSIDGGHADYAVAYARAVVRVPDGLARWRPPPLTCAGVTTYKAIKVADVRPTERVAIFGIGGLGHLASSTRLRPGTRSLRPPPAECPRVAGCAPRVGVAG